MRHALPLLLCATLAGCAGTQPHPYADLPASRELRLNTQDPSGRIPTATRRTWTGKPTAT